MTKGSSLNLVYGKKISDEEIQNGFIYCILFLEMYFKISNRLNNKKFRKFKSKETIVINTTRGSNNVGR